MIQFRRRQRRLFRPGGVEKRREDPARRTVKRVQWRIADVLHVQVDEQKRRAGVDTRAGPRRQQAGQRDAHDTGEPRERQRSSVEVQRVEGPQQKGFRQERPRERHQRPRDACAPDDAGNAEEGALDQRLANEPAARRAERRAHHGFAAPGTGPGE